MFVQSNFNMPMAFAPQRPILVVVVPLPADSQNWDSLIQDHAHEEEAAVAQSLLSGLMANFGSPKIEPMGETASDDGVPGAQPPAAPVDSISDITSQDAWIPVDAPQQNSQGQRSAATYSDVIDQFDVANNPRYAQRDGNTYCNIFAWDVTRAMGAEIPHYWQGRELDANGVADWLRDEGNNYGWHAVSEEEAQDMANQGKPVVVSWKNDGGIGHIGVVRPGEINENGPALAQAGSTNTNNAHVRDTFGSVDAIYYAHD